MVQFLSQKAHGGRGHVCHGSPDDGHPCGFQGEGMRPEEQGAFRGLASSWVLFVRCTELYTYFMCAFLYANYSLIRS